MIHSEVMNKIEAEIRETIGLTAKDLDGVMYYVNLSYTIGYESSYKKNDKKIQMINYDGDVVKEFNSSEEAARYVKGDGGNIRKICNGKGKTAYNYRWKWKTN